MGEREIEREREGEREREREPLYALCLTQPFNCCCFSNYLGLMAAVHTGGEILIVRLEYKV